MTFGRREFLRVAGATVAAPAILRSGRAHAADVTLKLHHFLPPVSNAHVNFLVPWAKKVESDSQGRIRIQIFPSMQLGGAPPQLYDQARDGVDDIVWTLPGYTAGRFPKTETFELPFVAARRAIVNSRATEEFRQTHLLDELREVHPICLWGQDHGVIHSRRLVKTMEDMQGLKVRFPTRLSGEALKALGASAIGMPVPQVPESISQGVIDSAVVPWEVVPALKLQELVKYHTEIPGSPTFYIATFMLVMNKAKYEGLPADLKAVMDANTGMPAAELAARAWDNAAVTASQAAQKRGNTIYTLTEDEAARWRKTTQPVIDAWLAQMKERGVDGAKLLEDARALIAKHDKA